MEFLTLLGMLLPIGLLVVLLFLVLRLWSLSIAKIVLGLGTLVLLLAVIPWFFVQSDFFVKKSWAKVERILSEHAGELPSDRLERTRYIQAMSFVAEGLANIADKKPDYARSADSLLKVVASEMTDEALFPFLKYGGRWKEHQQELASITEVLYYAIQRDSLSPHRDMYEKISRYWERRFQVSPYNSVHTHHKYNYYLSDNARLMKCLPDNANMKRIRDFWVKFSSEETAKDGFPCITFTSDHGCKTGPQSNHMSVYLSQIEDRYNDKAKYLWKKIKHSYKNKGLGLFAGFSRYASNNGAPAYPPPNPHWLEVVPDNVMGLYAAAHLGDRRTFYQINGSLWFKEITKPATGTFTSEDLLINGILLSAYAQ